MSQRLVLNGDMPLGEDARMMMRQFLRGCAALMMVGLTAVPSWGLQDGTTIEVSDRIKSVELVAGASQPLKYPFPFPKLMVQVPEVIDANPISTSEILVTGLKPGVSMLTVVDPQGNHHSLTVEVKIDIRILQRTIDRLYPNAQVQVGALRNSVILSGYVSEAANITNMLAVATDYFPTNPVINDLKVTKSQNVAIKVKVYEVSRSKLRELGVDWAYFGENFSVVSSVAELISAAGANGAQATDQTLAFGVFGDNSNFQAFIRALEKHNLAKLLDEPTLVAKDGRPAEFLSGGEIPIQVASGLGTNSIEFRPFGTKLDLVPIIHGQGRMTLEVRAEVSELDNSLSGDTTVPGFRVRRGNTGVEMTAGHTLALAGDYREEVETVKQGLPGVMDHPFWGAPFRRTSEQRNETELVFLITPQFIGEIEAHRMPAIGVGRNSVSPSDKELYIDGYIEVPKCYEDCQVIDAFGSRPPMIAPGAAQQLGQPGIQPGFQPTPIQTAPPTTVRPVSSPSNQFEPASPSTSMRPTAPVQYRLSQGGYPASGTVQPASYQQSQTRQSGDFAWPTRSYNR